jgi:hypothetical protein
VEILKERKNKIGVYCLYRKALEIYGAWRSDSELQISLFK